MPFKDIKVLEYSIFAIVYLAIDHFTWNLIENQSGFLSEYSKSTPSEDMAEIFSFLMTRKTKIVSIAAGDKIIRKKINFIKDNIYKIDKNFQF